MIFSVKKKNGFFGFLGPPSYGIGAYIPIGREMLCLPYAGFLETGMGASLYTKVVKIIDLSATN